METSAAYGKNKNITIVTNNVLYYFTTESTLSDEFITY